MKKLSFILAVALMTTASVLNADIVNFDVTGVQSLDRKARQITTSLS